jgi:PAS domain S-box-containing protein
MRAMDMSPAAFPADPGLAGPAGETPWQVLFVQHPLPMWVYDSDSLRFLAANQAAVDDYGWSEQEFLAMDLLDIRPPAEREQLRQHMAPLDTQASGQQWRHHKRNGELIEVETQSQPVRFAGRPARLVLARDITQLKRQQARSAHQERVLSLVAAGAPLADVMETIVRGVEAQHPGLLCSVLLLDAGGLRLRMGSAPSLPAFFNDAADGLPVGAGVACCGEAAFSGQRVIATDIQSDPRWQPYRELAARAGVAACWSEPIRSRAGAVLGTFATYHRHTHQPDANEIAAIGDMAKVAAIAIERKQADEALRQTQKLESLGTLAGGIAHDFNNILGAILGNVALARQDGVLPETAGLRLEQIQKSALRARLLVQQILAFSRRQAPQPVRQPLGPLVLDALDLLRATLPANVQLHTQLGQALPEVEADGTQVQQVLMNLCTNAWHAMAGAQGQIEVGVENVVVDLVAAAALPGLRPGRCAHLWVRDDGSGMDEATRARIFEPFFTTKPVGSGTGLGLAVVHGIVSEHHGAITVDTAPGQGAVFHVWLPAARTEALPVVLAPTPHAAGPAGSSRHVLFVDDDAVMLLTGEGLLRSRGYQVTTADSGLAALDALRAAPQSFDLVVTDHNMPDCSGLDLARLLFAVRPGLPLIICSGYIDAELQSRAAAAGVRAIVHKENVVEELAGTIERVMLQGR